MRLILIVGLLFVTFHSSAQTQNKVSLSNAAIKDFAFAAQKTWDYDMYGFKGMVYVWFRDREKSLADAAVAVESIGTNITNREFIFQCFHPQITRDEDRLFDYLNKMGMKAVTAQELTNYIRKRYPR